MDRPPRRGKIARFAKLAGIGAAGLVVVLAVALASTVVVLQGERLAAFVGKVLPENRGKIAIRSIKWRGRAYVDLLTNAPTPVEVSGLTITDPEGTVVLHVPHLSVRVPLRSAMAGNIHLHDLKVGAGSRWLFGAMKKQEGIGFTAALEAKAAAGRPPKTRPVPEKTPSAKQTVFQIVNAELDGFTATFDFPDAWGLELRNIKSPATLIVDGSFLGFDILGLEARDGGYLKVLTETLPFDHVRVNRIATTRERPNDIFLDVAAGRSGASTVIAKGHFTGIYEEGSEPGISMKASIERAADALTAVAAPRRIPGLAIRGDRARVALDLADAFARLKLGAQVSGLDVAFGQYAARNLTVRARTSFGDPMTASVDELGFLAPGGGRFALTANHTGSQAKARIRFDRFTTDSYLPAELRPAGAGKLNGGFTVTANIDRNAVTVGGLELALSRRHAAGLPAKIRVHGAASANPERVSTSGLTIEAPGASVAVRGAVDLGRKLLSLGLRAGTSDLPLLLTSLGLPPLARGAALSVDVGGTFERPRAKGDAVVQGLGLGTYPELPEVKTQFRLERGTLHVDSLGGEAFGGTLLGKGEVQLYKDTVSRMLASPIVRFRLDGREIELGTLLAYGVASGRISFSAAAEGPADKVRATLSIPSGATLELLGESWNLGGIEVEVDAKGLVVRMARLSRPSGAQIELVGEMKFGGAMRWTLDVRDVAAEGLPGVAGAGVPITGRISAHLEISGALPWPALVGTIALRDVTVRGARLGDGDIALASAPDRTLSVTGDLFRRFKVEATGAYGPAGPRVQAAVSFQQVVVEELAPEVKTLGEDAHAIVSGRVTLAWQPDRPPAIDVRLSELALSVSREVGSDGARRKIWVRNAGDLHATLAGDVVNLAPARLVTDGGEFHVEGGLSGNDLRAVMSGQLDLALVHPFLRSHLDDASGKLSVAVRVRGTRARPVAEGSLAVAAPLRLRPRALGADVLIPTGVVRLGGDSAELADLAVTIDGATVTLRGKTQLDERLTPRTVELAVDGEVSAKVLALAAPDAIAEAGGRARITARVAGPLATPAVSAKVGLASVSVRLRDVGRLIAIESGTIELTSRELLIRGVRTRIDEQGLLVIGGSDARPGRVQIKQLFPELTLGTVDIPMRGERISYRVPNSFEIDDLSFTFGLVGNFAEQIRLNGDVRLISGRYVRDFTVGSFVIRPRINESEQGPPVWEGKPLLAKMGLDFRVRTVGDSFVIQNNLAPEIHVIIDLHVGGTLANPQLAGNVRPTDGRFHLLGVRGDFDLVPNVNHITFVPTRSIEEGETPELNLEAENVVTDSAGHEHTVRMRIRGPIGQAAVDLSTTDGLDRNQTFLLLVSGRTTEDAARFGGRNTTLSSDVRTGTDVVGQLTRDTVANLVEPYIDDTLQVLTGRKLNLRPTVGADGFELKLGARASRQLDLQLTFLRGFQNQRRYRGEANLWLMDYVTLRWFGERLTLTPQQGLSEEIDSLNLELSLDFPLRLRRP